MIVQKGQKAPFYGVLVSEPRYKFYTEQTKLAEYYLSAPCTDLSEEPADKETLYFTLGGLALGLIVGYAVGSK